MMATASRTDEICALAASICTDYQGNVLNALKGAVERGHESVEEHAVFTFRIEGISRVALAQFTRHRFFSFSVESQRYCGAPSAKTMVVPESIRNSCYMGAVEKLQTQIDRIYNSMTTHGIKDEDARYIMPEGSVTKLYATANARELNHFFRLRCCNRAQAEMREMADKMLAQCYSVSPVLFAHAGPPCRYGVCT